MDIRPSPKTDVIVLNLHNNMWKVCDKREIVCCSAQLSSGKDH